ncbi:hypothetical protein [Actinoplanes sp. NPDC049265]|uniref:hypothetical protein n=1 Tax=Actinoplanes sp. NPDC049265 TaxID=3363902 RepID=UPI00371FCCB0
MARSPGPSPSAPRSPASAPRHAPISDESPTPAAASKVRPFIKPDSADEPAGEPTVVIAGEETPESQTTRVFVTNHAGVSEEHSAEELTASHQPTEPIPADRDKTDAIPADHPDATATADEPTLDTDADDPAVTADAEPPTLAADADEPAATADAEPPTLAADADEPAATADAEPPTLATDANEPTLATDADRSGADSDEPEDGEEEAGVDDEVPTVDVHRDGKETTVSVATPTDDDGTKTQVIRLPRDREVGAGPTRDFRGGGKTYLDGPGEQTQVIYLLEPVNAQQAAQQAAKARAAEQEARDKAAQEKARQAFKDRAALERARKAFAERAAAEARSHGEETQIIKLPLRRDSDGETTALRRDTGDPRTTSRDEQTTAFSGDPRATGRDEQTTVLARGSGDEPTTLLPRQRTGEERDAETTALNGSGGDEGETTALRRSGGNEGETTTLNTTSSDEGETTTLNTTSSDEGETTTLNTTSSDEGETTALNGLVSDENTTLLRHATVMAEPVDGVAGESRSRSIVEQERPDPGADPTTRLIPAQRKPEHERVRRPRSLMDMERPADEDDR